MKYLDLTHSLRKVRGKLAVTNRLIIQPRVFTSRRPFGVVSCCIIARSVSVISHKYAGRARTISSIANKKAVSQLESASPQPSLASLLYALLISVSAQV